MPDVDLVRERDALKAEVQQLRQQQWYLSPACDTPDSPYGGNGLTWTQYAQAEYKRAETAEAEIERLKERMSSLENLGYWAARNAHGAWSHPAHFVNCPVQVCFDAKATLGKEALMREAFGDDREVSAEVVTMTRQALLETGT